MSLNDDSRTAKSKFKVRNSIRTKIFDKFLNFLIKVKTLASDNLLYILDFVAIVIYWAFFLP